MGNSKTINSIRNTFTGVFFKLVNMLFPFAIRTIILYKLGVEYLGLNTLFSSVLQVLSLSELGFGTAVAFSMYKPIAENDVDKICALLKLLKRVYSVIGLITLAVGLTLVPFLPNLIEGEIPADVSLYALYFIYLGNAVLSYFLFAYKGILLNANQRMDVENVISVIVNLAMYVLQIVVLFLFKNYYVYIIFLPLSTLAINLFRSRRVKKMYPDFTCRGEVEKGQRKEIYKNIGALMGHKLSGVVIFPISNIIISAFLGLEELATFGNYFYVVNALWGIIAIFFSAITASVGNSMIVDSVDKNYKDFNVLTFVNVWLMGFMAITLLCLFQDFIVLWVGEEYLYSLEVMVLFVFYFYLWRFKDILCTYKDAAGMWKDDFLKPYFVTIISLVLTLILVPRIGVVGALLSGIVGFFVISMPWETRIVFKKYFKRKPTKYYFRMIIYTFVLVLVGTFTYFVCSFIPTGGVLNFLLKAVVCVALSNLIILLFSFWTPEFKTVYSKAINLLFKKKKQAE